MTTAIGFKAIVGQRQPIDLLKTLIANEKLPHALLFTGDEGVGKKMTARAFAMACNCLDVKKARQRQASAAEVDACGNCIPCKKIAGNHHPDIIHIGPLSSVIKIAQIRALLQTLTLKPNEANHRVVILSEAQTMNTQAANALLKVLEEPPDRTLLVLTATYTTDLLPTVVSRCRHIRFSPLDKRDILQLLAKSDRLDATTLEAIAEFSQGSFLRAKKYTDRRWLDQRNWIIRSLSKRMVHDGLPDIRYWLAFSERLSKKKDRVEESLEIVTIWLRDLLLVSQDPKRVINRDCLDTLSAVAKGVNRIQVFRQIDAVEHAKTALKSNTNTRLTLDRMVLQMSGVGDATHKRRRRQPGFPVYERS